MKVFELFELADEQPGSIVEPDFVKKVVLAIRKDCMKFLELSKNKPLFRGVTPKKDKNGRIEYFKDYKIVSIRDDRRPFSSKADAFFNWSFNAIIKKLFKVNRVRKTSAFCSGDYQQAEMYGNLGFVFPVGEFNYLWSPKISDSFEDLNLYDFIEEIFNTEFSKVRAWKIDVLNPLAKKLEADNNYDYDVLLDEADENIKKLHDLVLNAFVKTYKYQYNTNLDKALSSGHELALIGPGDYHLVSVEKIQNALGLPKSTEPKEVYKALIALVKDKKYGND